MPSRFIAVSQFKTPHPLLAGLLGTHEEVCCHGTLLDTEQEIGASFCGLDSRASSGIADYLSGERLRDPAHFLDTYAFFTGRKRLAGFFLSYHDLLRDGMQGALEYLQRNRDIAVVHLYSGDFWASEAPGLWGGVGQPVALELAPEKVFAAMTQFDRRRQRINAIFSSHRKLDMRDEAFDTAPAACAGKVTEFLGLDPVQGLERQMRPEGDRAFRSRIANFEALAASARGSEFARHFPGGADQPGQAETGAAAPAPYAD